MKSNQPPRNHHGKNIHQRHTPPLENQIPQYRKRISWDTPWRQECSKEERNRTKPRMGSKKLSKCRRRDMRMRRNDRMIPQREPAKEGPLAAFQQVLDHWKSLP
jgi:hypothetical protein